MIFLLACASPAEKPRLSHDTEAPAGDSADTSGGIDSGGDSGGDTAGPAITGPCAAYADPVATGTVQDAALDELSGLAVSRQNPGILWTHEDSGGEAELYALDAAGETVATVRLAGVENTDWEDLALAPCGAGWCLFVGDIGDRGTARSAFAVLVVEEPLLDGSPEHTLAPEVRPFVYPEDPEDAEGLAVLPGGTPLIVTKRADATAGLFALPAGAGALERLADVPTGEPGEDLSARATAADLSTDGETLLLRTYLHLYEIDLRDPSVPGEPRDVPFALELQGEAVAYDPLRGGFWQVAEGANPALWYTGCAD